MSTGSAPARGALFECAIVLLGAGVALGASSVSLAPAAAPSDEPIRLLWLSDLGAESSAAERAATRDEDPLVLASVPGAAYVLGIDDGSPRKKRRLAADYSMAYGLATSEDGAVVLAADDGSVSLWSPSGLPPEKSDLSLRWRSELDERPVSVGWDGGDEVWVATRQSQLMALSATDGSMLWSVGLGSRADAPPVRTEEALFVATRGALVRLDAATGESKWTVELEGPAVYAPSLFVTDDDDTVAALLASTRNGQLLAVDRESGELLWSVDLDSRLAGAPVLGESFVAVPTQDGAVHAMSLKGEALWVRQGVGEERTDLLLRAGSQKSARLVAVSRRLSVLDPASGEVVDEYPAGAVADLEQRFLDVMLEGKRPYSETEKVSLLEKETFPIRGRLFGRARLVGEDLVFGTEDGWIYWFDWASLRPIGRYRAGQRASGGDSPPIWATETLIASAGESVFGLDPASGDTLWRREVGPVNQLVSADTVAVIGEDRLDVLDPRTGARRWSARGQYRAVAVVDNGWLAFERNGAIQALDDAGNAGGPSLAPLSSIDVVAGLGHGRWAVASAEGQVAVIAWDAAPREIWEIDLDQPIESVFEAEATLVVSLADRLIGLSSLDGSSAWELPLAEGETPLPAKHVFITTADALRLYEPVTGTLSVEVGLEANVVGATLTGDSIVWLDASGTVHRAPLVPDEGSVSESVSLGDRLARATFQNGKVLVTTDAGEIGLIELTLGRATFPSSNDFPQEEKK